MNCKKMYLEWLGYNEYEIEEVETEIKNGEKPLEFESYKYYTWESGYNKALEEVKHDLMMKLKDEGLVKPLKDSILRNERLSSQEQQELCAWIECAMDFGENLDECAKELEEANKANEWHYVKDGDLPKEDKNGNILVYHTSYGGHCEVGYFKVKDKSFRDSDIIAWKEIIPPKESE